MSAKDCSKYDDYLSYVGDFGPYQIILIVLMILTAFLYGFSYGGHMFMVLVPEDHWCRINELEALSKEEQLALGIPKDEYGEFERCARYDVDFVDKMNISKANESWPQISCDNGWIYDKDQVPYETIATEGNWVCDDDELVTHTSTIYILGSVLGCLVFGYMCDHLGRVISLFMANSCALIGGSLSALCNDFGTFSATRFLAGMAHDCCCTPIYILVMENVGIKYRAVVGNIAFTFGFPVALVILPWIAYYVSNWRYFALAMALPVLLVVLMCFLLPESPNWLLSVGKIEKGMKGLKKVAKINRKTVSDAEWSEMQRCYELKREIEHSAKMYNFKDLFRTCRRTAVILMLITNWSVLCLVYDAHMRIVSSLGTDAFTTFSMASLTEIPAGILAMLLVDRIGRKPLMISTWVCCGIFSFLSGIFPWRWPIAIAAIFARFFATVAYNVSQQWSVEILPTVVRGQGWAIINVLGHSIALMSPSIIYTKNYYDPLPMFIITVFTFLGAAVVICLPETKGVLMPHTPEEAEIRWTLRFRDRKATENQ